MSATTEDKYCWKTYGSLSIPDMLRMIEKRDDALKLADQLVEQVLPQVGGIVLDIGRLNDFCMAMAKFKMEQKT